MEQKMSIRHRAKQKATYPFSLSVSLLVKRTNDPKKGHEIRFVQRTPVTAIETRKRPDHHEYCPNAARMICCLIALRICKIRTYTCTQNSLARKRERDRICCSFKDDGYVSFYCYVCSKASSLTIHPLKMRRPFIHHIMHSFFCVFVC